MKTFLLSLLLLSSSLSLLSLVRAAEPDAASCPVIRHATTVVALSDAELQGMQLTALQRDQMQMASANNARAFKVVMTPLGFAHNDSKPSVEWVDLHFRVNSQPLENVQMSNRAASSPSNAAAAVSAAAVPPESDASKMASSSDSAVSASSSQSQSHSAAWTFAPIFLSPSDVLSFRHTLSAQMINCETEQQTFSPQTQEAPADLKMGVGVAGAQPAAEVNLNAQQPQVQAPVSAVPQSFGASVPSAAAMPPASPSAHCPAIAFTPKVSCGDAHCKVQSA